MSLVAFLELLEHDVQSQIVEDKVARVLVELAKHPQGSIVVCVDKGEVFDVQKRQNVLPVSFVHRNT